MALDGTMCISLIHIDNMDLQTFTDEQSWVDAATSYLLADEIKNIGLSGGSTPGKVYEAFARAASADRQYTFIQIDERFVPPDHPDSNQRQANMQLAPVLSHATFVPVPTQCEAESAAKTYEQEIRHILPLDIAVLGIGPDGHTASLFPHSPALHSAELVAHTTTDMFAVRDRITLTFPAIMQSKGLLVLLRGAEKKTIIASLQNNSTSIEEFPAIALLPHKQLTVLFLDS